MKTYTRTMSGWWRRNPFYLWYTLREWSAFFLTGYALVLLVGLARLAQGEAQYEAWRSSLASPGAIIFHIAAMLIVLYHAWTWFKVMHKTLPFLYVGGRRLPDSAIFAAGIAASVVLSLLIFWGFA
jgi:fumarate reductase subunit C